MGLFQWSLWQKIFMLTYRAKTFSVTCDPGLVIGTLCGWPKKRFTFMSMQTSPWDCEFGSARPEGSRRRLASDSLSLSSKFGKLINLWPLGPDIHAKALTHTALTSIRTGHCVIGAAEAAVLVQQVKTSIVVFSGHCRPQIALQQIAKSSVSRWCDR